MVIWVIFDPLTGLEVNKRSLKSHISLGTPFTI